MAEVLEQLVNKMAQSQVELQQQNVILQNSLKEATEATRVALQEAQVEASNKWQEQQIAANERLAAQQLDFQQQLQAARNDQQQEVAQLVVALGGIANLPADNAILIRARNVLSMRKEFWKSQQCKRFTEKQDLKPKDWLKRFTSELD